MKQQEPVNVKIQHTYKYDMFKLIGVNRQTDKKHVRNIAKAIQQRNLLHLFPVIMNIDWEVLDGQHRLAAVKLIKEETGKELSLYFVIDPKIDHDDMRLLNSNKINWKVQDYINYFAGKKVPAYTKLMQFQKENPLLNISTSVELISDRSRNLKEIKSGTLVVNRYEHASKVMNFIYTLKDRMDSQVPLWKTRDFIRAMNHVVLTGKYKHATMLASTRNSPDMWNRQINMRSYLFEITQTYNHNLMEKDKVNFLKLVREY